MASNVAVIEVDDVGVRGVKGEPGAPGSSGAASTVLFPEQFGADPSGGNWSDDAFEAMVSYVNDIGGNAVVEMVGRYKLAAHHQFNVGNVLIDGKGSGLIDASAASLTDEWAILHFKGPGFAPRTTLVGAVAKDATVLPVVDGSTFSAGSRGVLTSTGEYWRGIAGVGGFGITYKGELFIVQSVSGNTLTLETPLRDSYDGATYTTYARRVDTIDGIEVRDLRAVGPGGAAAHTSSNPLGVRALRFEYARDVFMQNLRLENFPRFGIESNIGWNHKAVGLRLQGRKLDDPSNLPAPANSAFWFTGWIPMGVFGVDVIAPSADWVRRIVDPDASEYLAIDADPNQSVPSRDIKVTGGHSRHCFTGPGGHNYENLDVVNHTVEGANVGINHRGKNLRVIGGSISAANGIVLGLGATGSEDPNTYSEDPNCGSVDIIACPIQATLRGIYATSSWERLRVDTRIEAPIAIQATGKRQDNLDVKPDFKMVGGGATQVGIHSKYDTGKLSSDNWRIRDGRIEGFIYGIWHEGAGAKGLNNLKVDGVDFADITTNYLRFAGANGALGKRNVIAGCSVTGTAATTPVSGASIFTADNYGDFGNEWANFNRSITIASGIVTIPTMPGIFMFRLDTEGAAATDDLTDILGGTPGQIIVLGTAASARVVTLKQAVNKLELGGADIVLNNQNHRVMLVKISNAVGWARPR